MPKLKDILNMEVQEAEEPKGNGNKTVEEKVPEPPDRVSYDNLKATLKIKVGNVFLKPITAKYVEGNNEYGSTWQYYGLKNGKKILREVIIPADMPWEYENGRPVFCIVDGSLVGKPMACASDWDNMDIGRYIHCRCTGATVDSLHVSKSGFVLERWMAVCAIIALLVVGGLVMGYQYLNPPPPPVETPVEQVP